MKENQVYFQCKNCLHNARPMEIHEEGINGEYTKPNYCENCGANGSQMITIVLNVIRKRVK